MRYLCTILLALPGSPGGAQEDGDRKKVIACTIPLVEALAREVGGDDFEYFSLSKADQDPHYVSPTPVLQKKLRRADAFIEVGLQLELWADLLANDAGRPRLQRGQSARFVASDGIPREQIPAALTRAAGHIHPEGNPHLWLDPLRGKRMAANIARALIATAPEKREAVEKRLKDFQRRIDEAVFGAELVKLVGSEDLERRALDGTLHAYLETESFEGKKLAERLGGWLKKAERLRGRKTVEFHQVWVYVAKLFGFEIVGTIEEKPGIPPGPRHQVELTRRIREEKIALIIVDNFYHLGLPRTIADDTGCPMVVLPNQPGGEAGTETYVKLFEHIVDRLVSSLKE